MNGRIEDEKINQIREAVDIVDLIGEYVQLKKQGRNYFGLCPFHGENSPSFSVSTEKQIFHCFGCGAGGNIFTFLMDIEGYSFVESAKVLAEKGNVPLEVEINKDSKRSNMPAGAQQMVEAHDLLRKFYHHLLVNTKEGQDALEYLLKRGFTEETIEKFQIGYSLDSWDFVSKFLLKRGFPAEYMEQAGLIIFREKDESYFDRFRNRVMFPIMDHQGNTIAFSGRAMGDDEPKYLNSPETPIFNKSKTLYNFHHARPHIRKKEQAVIFEGFADCISAVGAGVENAVATMGTALTDQHIQLLKRNTDQILICYDSDSAGLNAANRAVNMLQDHEFSVKVALMPDNLDPDDYIKEFGEKSFVSEVIGASLTYMAFKMHYLRRGKNVNNEGDRIQYIEEVLKEISRLPNAVERDHYLRQLSSEFSLSLDALEQQQRQVFFTERKKGTLPQPAAQKKMALQYEHKLKPAHHNAETKLIAHMLKSRDMTFKIQQLLGQTVFHVDEHQAIITYLYAFYEDGHEPDTSFFLTYLPDPNLRRIVSEIEMMSVNEEVTDKELTDCINQVLKYEKLLKIKEKQVEEKDAVRRSDYVTAAQIAMEIIKLRKML
ncbi:DNA primase [Peribacillus frigoritolerans]|uniref:DNA primase n=1 Tax=Peribacillus TaxID=2675229 RepID=UPI000BA71386|nr:MULTISPECIES: DNA primase [Peribacillus]MBD8135032.1 DNA primase [Bacillus sp. CFBP 13597]MBT2602462.1 DNA primase [Bacillus sp. ISL-53]MEC0298110.1 DNA primase [Peribacillus castrilensis]PHD73489.1 DNA primase [Bacillus sp. AFS043905]PRS39170.1 DNA primase [Bacillus sp. RJGP41]QNK51473.1 DNA primase [Brevibacterium sp. PAMC23299]